MDKTLSIAIGSDHAGFEYKELLKDFLENSEIKDFGAYSAESADYPDFAHPVASAVESGEFKFGILVCGSANGVAITANKHELRPIPQSFIDGLRNEDGSNLSEAQAKAWQNPGYTN